MNLNLKYPPTPENAPRFADDIVAAAKEVSGIDLDYSVGSLEKVDNLIESFRGEGLTSEQIAETLFGFGCYVGEVFVRNAKGQWTNSDQTQMAALGPSVLVIAWDSGQVCNPIGKVFKRMQNGAEDDLRFFYQVMSGLPKSSTPNQH